MCKKNPICQVVLFLNLLGGLIQILYSFYTHQILITEPINKLYSLCLFGSTYPRIRFQSLLH